MIKTAQINNLGKNLDHLGLRECDVCDSKLALKFVMERLRGKSKECKEEFFPLGSRVSAALLGAFPVHHRVGLYDKQQNLQKIVEAKVNDCVDKKIILAINSSKSYYCFETSTFSYDQLFGLEKLTFATDYILVLQKLDGLLILHEDSPACFISFLDESSFSADFIPSQQANDIFCEEKLNWQITKLPTEKDWLEKVQSCLILNDPNL